MSGPGRTSAPGSATEPALAPSTTGLVRGGVGRLRTALQDPLLRNSWLILATTVMSAAAGSVFWIIAARLSSSADVGLAGSLVSTGEAIGVLAQLGLNIALVSVMPTSRDRAADSVYSFVVVGVMGFVLATAYGLLLPLFSPTLADEISPWWMAIVFGLLVASTGVNQLTDGIFLAIDRVAANLRINGIVLSTVKCALPFFLAGAGGFGLYAAVGIAGLVAAVLSIISILAAVEGTRRMRPSAELRRARSFTRAGYVAHSLYLAPQFVLPIIIINQTGAVDSAEYFLGFQIVTLLNAVVYAVSNSMHAEGARQPDVVEATARKAGLTILGATAIGVVVVVAAAPLLLLVFGQHYADEGTDTLRVLALGTFGVGLNNWAIIRLRLAGHRRAMVLVQLFSTIAIIGLAAAIASHGTAYVALAWGVGQLAGGLLGCLVSFTVAPLCNGHVHTGDLPVEPEPAGGAAAASGSTAEGDG